MKKYRHIPMAILVWTAWTGLALAQGTPPGAAGAATQGAGQAGAPAVAQGGGRGGFVPAPVVIGPPAPVPPEVAIPRPTPEELAQVNAALKKFIDADTSSTKPLLKKFESLMLLQPPRRNVAATFTQTTQRHGSAARRVRRDREAGRTSICCCTATRSPTGGCRATPTRRCSTSTSARIRTANFAIAGDTTQGVLWGLRNGEGQGFQPKAVMLMIGTNNSGATTPGRRSRKASAPSCSSCAGTFRTRRSCCWRSSRAACRAIPCATRSPRSTEIIARLDDQQHVFYMDIGAKFLDEKGVFLPDTFRPDNLHPQAKGYDIWGEAVKDKLAELMKQP